MCDFKKNEWCAIINFLQKEGLSPTEAGKKLKLHYGDSAPDRSTVSRWMRRFTSGRQSLEDDPRSGAPTTAKTCTNIDVVKDLLNADRWATYDELEEQSGLSRGTLQRIIHEELKMKKVCTRWVPCLLTEEQRQSRHDLCVMNLNMLEELGDNFWCRIITADETPLPHFMPETKRQCMQWVAPGESRPVHAKSAPSVGKFQLTVFWGCDGIIHMDYCPPKQTINAAYYSSLLQTVHSKLPRVRPGKIHKRPLFLQDNARIHTAKVSMNKLRELKWQLLPHPAYSPDLAPSDFHLFGPLKDPLRGRRFDSESELKSAVNAVVKTLSKDWFEEGMKKVAEQWRKCIDLQGDYVEK